MAAKIMDVTEQKRLNEARAEWKWLTRAILHFTKSTAASG
jgi:hypothetical protein